MSNLEYGLLGEKLGHSFSPAIHKKLAGYDYRLVEKKPEELADFLAHGTFKGLNVTIPYKKAVIPFCQTLTDQARRIGSVNTIVRQKDGTLLGHNTDYDGFAYMLRSAGAEIRGKKALILGTGGVSPTVKTVLEDLGTGEIVFISRSGPDNYENLSRHADAEIVVNTTPVGMYPNTGTAPVDLRSFPACEGVLDVVYNPQRTALLLQAEELGIPCSGGLPMLVAQAKAAVEHFFEKAIPDSENERILAGLRQESGNIILIGMPGCGKTTVGEALARLTGREAIDIDQRIEARAGCSIPALFAREGETAFRALEREETAAAGKLSGKILITGGGVVKDPRNYAPLHQNGRIYHLTRALEVLPVDGRPLSQSTDLQVLWQERAPLYERFRDAVIDNSGTVEDTAAAVWRDFCAHSGD